MKLLLALLSAAVLSGSPQQPLMPKAPAIAAPALVAQGRIVAVEPTRRDFGPHATPVRWRWLVELAPPLMLPGNPDSSIPSFSRVKTFSFTLADTAVFRRGTRISFTYQPLPWSPPQWYSAAEALSSALHPPYFDFPEIILSNVQAL